MREALARLLHALANWLDQNADKDDWAFQPGLEPNLGKLAMDVQKLWDRGYNTDDMVLYLPMASLRPTFKRDGVWRSDFGKIDLRIRKDIAPGSYRLELKGFEE